MSKPSTTKEFIEKIKHIFPKYNWDLVEYILIRLDYSMGDEEKIKILESIKIHNSFKKMEAI